MYEKIQPYMMAAMTVGVAVSTVLHLLGLDAKPWAKPVLSLCFDVIGMGKGLMGANSKDGQ
jgi:hypothetical protein